MTIWYSATGRRARARTAAVELVERVDEERASEQTAGDGQRSAGRTPDERAIRASSGLRATITITSQPYRRRDEGRRGRGPRASGAEAATSIVGTTRRSPRSSRASRNAPATAAASATVETRSGRPFERSRSTTVPTDPLEHHGEMNGRLEAERPPDRPEPRGEHAATHAAPALPHGLSVVRSPTRVSRVPGCSVVLVVVLSWPRRVRRLRLDRGRLAAEARARGARRRASPGARRASDRASLRLPPRRAALARQPRERDGQRAGSRSVGPTSSASPETSSRIRAASVGCVRSSHVLDDPFVVLGNHDVAVTRDPFSRAAELRDLERARLLTDEAATRRRARPAGLGRGRRPGDLPREASQAARARRTRAALRLLLCHFPGSSSGSRRVVRPDPRRAPARRSDLPPAPGSPHHARASPRAASSRASTRRGQARCTFAGDGHDVRPVPVLRPPRGDGARPSAAGLGVCPREVAGCG